MKNYLFLPVALCSLTTSAQQPGVTNEGRSVILYNNGSWLFADITMRYKQGFSTNLNAAFQEADD